MPHRYIAMLTPLLFVLAGCNDPKPANPTFRLTVSQARAALEEMRRNPKPLARPVVLMHAYLDPGNSTEYIKLHLVNTAIDCRLIEVNFLDCRSFDQCRAKVIQAVAQRFPTSDPRHTIQVDAVGASMGGLVARYAAMPTTSGRRLRLARLFTIAAPHRGARFANPLMLDSLVRDMSPDSSLIREINRQSATAGYQLYPYVWLGDEIVGAGNAAPPGSAPWWLAGLPLRPAHTGAMRDPRIAADIARRLRNEKPYTIYPPAPLP